MEIFDFAKTNIPNTQSTEVVQKKKDEHEYKLIGRVRRIQGLTMFSFNLITGEIKEAPVEKCKIVDFKTQKPIQNAKISIEKKLHIQAGFEQKEFNKAFETRRNNNKRKQSWQRMKAISSAWLAR